LFEKIFHIRGAVESGSLNPHTQTTFNHLYY